MMTHVYTIVDISELIENKKFVAAFNAHLFYSLDETLEYTLEKVSLAVTVLACNHTKNILR